jgi:uncharacterized protein
MLYLLDVNVLIARCDPRHEFHELTKQWLSSRKDDTVLLCPITENGFLRIFGHPAYPKGPGSPARAAEQLAALRRRQRVRFIPDSISIVDHPAVPRLQAITPKQITDLYLIALASANGARFATFDDHIPAHLVSRGPKALEVIGPTKR